MRANELRQGLRQQRRSRQLGGVQRCACPRRQPRRGEFVAPLTLRKDGLELLREPVVLVKHAARIRDRQRQLLGCAQLVPHRVHHGRQFLCRHLYYA